MSQKKPLTSRLKNTLNDLDSAIEQWDSITNKPEREQGTSESPVRKKTKKLLKELRDQIKDFESLAE